MEVFGKRLEELRTDKGLSQKRLAEIFDVAQRTISAWETNKQEPSFETLLRLAKYFEVTAGYLLGEED